MARWTDQYVMGQRVEVFTGVNWTVGRIIAFTPKGKLPKISIGVEDPWFVTVTHMNGIRPLSDLKAHSIDVEAHSPLDFEDVPPLINQLRQRLLCDHDSAGCDPEAVEFYLLAIDALGQAERFANLATYKQRQLHTAKTYGGKI